jgi:WG containing repeat
MRVGVGAVLAITAIGCPYGRPRPVRDGAVAGTTPSGQNRDASATANDGGPVAHMNGVDATISMRAGGLVDAGIGLFECDCYLRLVEVPNREPGCLHRVGGSYRMRRDFMAAHKLDRRTRVFAAYSSCGTFYVRSDGYAMPTQDIDNGADYFCNGLVRYVIDGKYGYIDRKLDVVVPAIYGFAFPFGRGHGVVCNDCQFVPDGEYTRVDCKVCGAVNTHGKLVVPLKMSQAEVRDKYLPSDSDCELKN